MSRAADNISKGEASTDLIAEIGQTNSSEKLTGYRQISYSLSSYQLPKCTPYAHHVVQMFPVK